MTRRGAARWLALGLALGAGACAGGDPGDPAAERGRHVYLAYCTACHHATDPSKPGPVGPAIKGSSADLLEAKVVRGRYPPGYTPKRDSAVMQPMPQVAPSLADLGAYLR